MKLLRVSGTAFCGQDFEYALPSHGVVLVAGPNGAGKSARFIDAVCYAMWGKTERGVDPWTASPGSVTAATDTFTITRKWTGKSLSVKLTATNGSQDFTTNTAATQEVVRRYMPLDAWKLCARLTSNDIAAFSRAAAGKELAMIESVLGLGWIKKASSEAERIHREATRTFDAARAAHNASEIELRGIERVLEVSSALLGTHPVPPRLGDPSPSDLGLLRETVRTLEAQRYVPRNTQAPPQNNQRAGAVPRCQSCGQPLPQHAVPEQHGSAGEVWLGRSAEQLAPQDGDSETSAYAELAAAESLHREWDTYRSAVASRARAIRDLRLAEESDRYLHACLHTVECDRHQERARTQDEIAATVHQLFRAGGIREVLLADALAALAHTATSYCHAMGLSVVCTLGLLAGKVSFSVEGVGGRHGYDGASSGQRRRIDIAMALAMADSSQYGRQTLWLDEVFDSLDEAGIEQVVDLVHLLSRQRQVILLTHNRTAMELLLPTAAMSVHLTR